MAFYGHTREETRGSGGHGRQDMKQTLKNLFVSFICKDPVLTENIASQKSHCSIQECRLYTILVDGVFQSRPRYGSPSQS